MTADTMSTYQAIHLGLTLFAILLSGGALTVAILAYRKNSANSEKANALAEARLENELFQMYQEAVEAVRKFYDENHEFLARDPDLMNEAERATLTRKQLQGEMVMTNVLNMLDQACHHYRFGKCDKAAFRRKWEDAVREHYRHPANQVAVTRPGAAFHSLKAVHDEWFVSNRLRSGETCEVVDDLQVFRKMLADHDPLLTSVIADEDAALHEDDVLGEGVVAVRASRRIGGHAHGFLRELQYWTAGQVLLSLAVKFFVAHEGGRVHDHPPVHGAAGRC